MESTLAYQRILVAIEISAEAEPILAAAQEQAGFHEQASLHLVSVVRPLNHAFAGLDPSSFSVAPALEADIVKHTKDTLNKWAATRNIPQSAVHWRTGNAAAEIKQCAEDIDADLIVIGTHGRHGLGLLLGSTANAVLHGIGCDAYVVKVH